MAAEFEETTLKTLISGIDSRACLQEGVLEKSSHPLLTPTGASTWGHPESWNLLSLEVDSWLVRWIGGSIGGILFVILR